MARKRNTSPRKVRGGKWVFQYNSPEEEHEDKLNQVIEMLRLGVRDVPTAFAAIEQVRDYFPGENEVPEDGAWILINRALPCLLSPPPLSIWFAEPWPMTTGHFDPHRVKIITPRGEIGVFPHEYAIVKDPTKYFEFLGEGMDVKYFGTDTAFSAEFRAKLFYIRSRGVSKRDAMTMLVGSIKAHSVLWFESSPEVGACFGLDWPEAERLATYQPQETTTGETP